MLDPSPSLYERLGGYDGVDRRRPAAAAARRSVSRRLLEGKCKDSLRKDSQLIVDFLGAAFGGPVVYLGRPMKMSIAALVPVPGNDRASRALQQ
jgi:hypothetical protein